MKSSETIIFDLTGLLSSTDKVIKHSNLNSFFIYLQNDPSERKFIVTPGLIQFKLYIWHPKCLHVKDHINKGNDSTASTHNAANLSVVTNSHSFWKLPGLNVRFRKLLMAVQVRSFLFIIWIFYENNKGSEEVKKQLVSILTYSTYYLPVFEYLIAVVRLINECHTSQRYQIRTKRETLWN